MKQVLQDPGTGAVTVMDVPAPMLLPGCLLVRIAASLVSAGTERASSEFASMNLLHKAKARPDLVRDVLNKVRRDGLFATIDTVRARLDQPSSVGYSSAGTVVEVGAGITDVQVGDRVACAGAGFAVHAEFGCVPRLLAARIPAGSEVSFEEAAFTTLGAVALHGIRIADVKLGDTVAVVGLGLLGQLTVQILKAAGCRVIGIDIVLDRAQLAERLGADRATDSTASFIEMCHEFSGGQGADAVLITAETSSSDPVNLAAQVARDRATIVAVGTVGFDLQRRLYYEKELNFRVSRSYGPGRHDVAYEQKGRDYPIGYVRWTETRNMEAFLQLLADRKLNVASLITHRLPIEDAPAAYQLITGKSREPFMGVVIQYSTNASLSPRIALAARPERMNSVGAKIVAIGFLGAGGFAQGTLLPAIKKIPSVQLVGVCNATGPRARHAGDKFGFRYCTTDENEILNDSSINTVVIATRHHLHASQVLAALSAGKHVFCEKPLCLTESDLAEIVEARSSVSASHCLLMVGFNRRFAPMAMRMKSFLAEREGPLALHYRVNAGQVPADHWVNDPEQGGGRILGEVCHFIDVLTFLAGSSPIEVQARALSASHQSDVNVTATLRFANGSLGTIDYLTNGDKSYSKERLEVFAGGAVAVLEDFRSLELVGNGRKQVFRSRLHQDKGHCGEWEAFAAAIVSGKSAPIAFEQIVSATLATLRLQESLTRGQPMSIDASRFPSLIRVSE